MKYLLDTHIIVWMALNSPSLPNAARAIIENEASQLYISAASIWETSIKGAQRMGISAEHLCEDIEATGCIIVGVNARHAVRVGTLPDYHHDPFDRILLAQALVEGMRLVSADRQLVRYGEPVFPV